MKKPKIKITLIGKKGIWVAIAVTELGTLSILTLKEENYALWQCMLPSRILTFFGMAVSCRANPTAALFSAVRMWM